MKINLQRHRLGRTLNENTRVWEFSDGSSPIPDEIMQKIYFYMYLSSEGVLGAGITALSIKWGYEEKMKKL